MSTRIRVGKVTSFMLGFTSTTRTWQARSRAIYLHHSMLIPQVGSGFTSKIVEHSRYLPPEQGLAHAPADRKAEQEAAGTPPSGQRHRGLPHRANAGSEWLRGWRDRQRNRPGASS